MRVLITGGAGFIGSHLGRSFAERGDEVVVYDDLSRPGSHARLLDLTTAPFGSRIRACVGDVTDAALVADAVVEARPDLVLHLAAQVAVSDSLSRPAHDFAVNACGTLNVLEAVRRSAPQARVVVASSNKVYGSLADVRTSAGDTRYELTDHPSGIAETHPTAARTPYGCSKLVADTYTCEYARSYGMATAVLRLSCVYGPGQSGSEDQGWVSWFVRSAVGRRPLTVYGDGRQVRDLLHVSDLVRFVHALAGEDDWPAPVVCNIGGGRANSVSVWGEFGPLLEREVGHEVAVSFAPARQDDQLVYISDNRRARRLTGWAPSVSVVDGVRELIEEARTSERHGHLSTSPPPCTGRAWPRPWPPA